MGATVSCEGDRMTRADPQMSLENITVDTIAARLEGELVARLIIDQVGSGVAHPDSIAREVIGFLETDPDPRNRDAFLLGLLRFLQKSIEIANVAGFRV
jgi:hypothetical protein